MSKSSKEFRPPVAERTRRADAITEEHRRTVYEEMARIIEIGKRVTQEWKDPSTGAVEAVTEQRR